MVFFSKSYLHISGLIKFGIFHRYETTQNWWLCCDRDKGMRIHSKKSFSLWYLPNKFDFCLCWISGKDSLQKFVFLVLFLTEGFIFSVCYLRHSQSLVSSVYSQHPLQKKWALQKLKTSDKKGWRSPKYWPKYQNDFSSSFFERLILSLQNCYWCKSPVLLDNNCAATENRVWRTLNLKLFWCKTGYIHVIV